MDSGDAIQIIALIVLLILSAFFSSAETALTTVNRIRIRSLVEEGNKRAQILSSVIDDTSKMLSAILIGNNIVNLSASSIATTMAIEWTASYGAGKFASYSAGIATGVLTLVILVFGEISPKTIATLYSEKLALAYAKVIYALMFVLTPVIFLVNCLSYGFLRLFRIDASKRTSAMTETELRTILDVSHEDGVIESEEREMINNVVDFGDSFAKDIMVPRINVTFAEINHSYEEVLEIFKRDKYTRLPVYEDTIDNVIGIINMKDLLLFDKNEQETFHIRNILREPYYTYEFKKTSELLMEMKAKSVSFAIVLDEYGATAGIITMEDLIEEIVGEIRDEYDSDEEELIQKISDYEYIVEGSTNLDDLSDMLHIDLHSEDYDSVGGLIIELLDRLPEQGESVETDNQIRLVVESVDKTRIDSVRIYLPETVIEEEKQA